jgi:(2Fe-2S) ferredoxin
MPPLDIDHKRPLSNTIPPYTSHVLVKTGQTDWYSRIEDTPTAAGRFIAQLKHALGPKGAAYDPQHPIMITTSSFPANDTPENPSEINSTGSLLLFPGFRHYRANPLSDPTILPKVVEAIRSSLPNAQVKPDNSLSYTRITIPTILICSHNSRDTRCGTLGPILRAEFVTQLSHLGLATSTEKFLPQADPQAVNVGCISHIGGHAWAGNVIIYFPGDVAHGLAGMGVWYGRVEPRHVEGIVRETVLGGRVIEELFRGGIGRDGRRLWV